MKSLLFQLVQRAWDLSHPHKRLALIHSAGTGEECRAISGFYEQCGLKTVTRSKFSLMQSFGYRYVAYDLVELPRSLRILTRLGRAFECNRDRNPLAPWRWHEALTSLNVHRNTNHQRTLASRSRLEQLRSLNLERAFIFGTGPSLDRALEFNYSDGYRIVCNTIVKNVELLRSLSPHIIVAGDALYHFSETAHARKFRDDLCAWLQQSETLFVYPEQYDASVRALSPERIHQQLVPIPQGRSTRFVPGLDTEFALPNLGNVLNLLLIPVAAYLAPRVSLLGFDGRDPNATGFWPNSTANSYPELIDELNREYPAFRQLFVPDSDPEQYVREVLGSKLRERIEELRGHGVSLDLLSPSYLEGLKDLSVG